MRGSSQLSSGSSQLSSARALLCVSTLKRDRRRRFIYSAKIQRDRRRRLIYIRKDNNTLRQTGMLSDEQGWCYGMQQFE